MNNKTVLITGAGGFLGRELLFHLKQSSDFFVYAVTSNPARLRGIISAPNIEVIDRTEVIPWKQIDIVLHCAFSRSENAVEIVKSLDYCQHIFISAILNNVPAIINISSQSVYGEQPPKWTEDTPVEPQGVYAMGKYAAELLLKSLTAVQNITTITNLRLSSILMNARFVNIFVQNALNGNPIKVLGGGQKYSFIDVRDAAIGIIAFMKTEYSKWSSVYNLGTSEQISVLEIANLVKEIAPFYITLPISIIIENEDIKANVCMDASKFYNITNWKPKYNTNDMIISLFEYKINGGGGGIIILLHLRFNKLI